MIVWNVYHKYEEDDSDGNICSEVELIASFGCQSDADDFVMTFNNPTTRRGYTHDSLSCGELVVRPFEVTMRYEYKDFKKNFDRNSLKWRPYDNIMEE